jgi:Kef-type K+ transport system membrane component KefB
MTEQKAKGNSGIGVVYVALTAATVGIYLLVRHFGASLIAPDRAIPLGPLGSVHSAELSQVMVALAVIALLSRVLGIIGGRLLKQPQVIGEIVAGILLGPSVLGILAPSVFANLFPHEVLPSLSIIAKVGVVLFMFVIGLEIDAPALRQQSRATIIVSHASIIVPFALGSMLALVLYPMYATSDVSFTAFSLFFGISLSLTAFPVLARILREYRVQHTPLGVTALACAAIDDVTAWTLLALVVGIATAKIDDALKTLPLLIGYMVVMMMVVRPLFQKLSTWVEKHEDGLSINVLTVAFVGLLLSAAATEYIGIHALFGAFLFGVFLPHEGKLAQALRTRVEDLVGIVFLPAFFAFTGLRTQIGLISGAEDWLICGGIILVAIVGKFGGTYVAGRMMGMNNRESAALGVLMNTRGLVELIVLNMGLDLGVLSPRLFAMLVLMALVTTFMTSPAFHWLVMRRGVMKSMPSGATADGSV